MTESPQSRPFLPPRWFIHVAWHVHRAMVRVTGGRRGLWPPRPGKWGALRLTTVGRRTGRKRQVIIAYLVDGPNLFGLAMNGWGAPEPAWWLNLQSHPDAEVELRNGSRLVRARAAEGDERARLWERLKETDPKLDEYAALRPTPTAIVVLEPRT
jgi:deazaflavin-dependent oxidoreductase (nitroreductase family)